MTSIKLLTILSVLLVLGAASTRTAAFAQGIRVETSEQIVNQRQVGWERVLTTRDHNLSHWHWEPITNSYRKVQTRTIYDTAPHTATLKEPMTKVSRTTAPGANSSGNTRTFADTNGRLMRQAPVSVPSPQPMVYTYGTLSRSQPHLDSGQQAHTRVAGKIVRLRNSNI